MRSGFVTHEWTNPTCPAFHWSHNFKHKPLTIPGVNNQVPVIAQRCLSCHEKRPDVATKREEVNQAGDAGARLQELISFSYFRR
jgi:nitrate reductase cytochrome c-type subunit